MLESVAGFTKFLLYITHTPNWELRMRPHLPRYYNNNTLLYCPLVYNNW